MTPPDEALDGGKIILTAAQKRLLVDMLPGQWYGDRVADDVKPFPPQWDKRTFRQVLRNLRQKGVLEKRMRQHDYGASFNVRISPALTPPASRLASK